MIVFSTKRVLFEKTRSDVVVGTLVVIASDIDLVKWLLPYSLSLSVWHLLTFGYTEF